MDKKHVKLIFLDIDGVLNAEDDFDIHDLDRGYYITGTSIAGISDEKMSLLKKLVDETKALIVLSSSWRYSYDEYMRHKDAYDDPECEDFLESKAAKYLIEKLNKFELDIFDTTLAIDSFFNYGSYSGARGKQIKKYIEFIEGKEVVVDNFVILDDEMFDYRQEKIVRHLVFTDYKKGLTEKDIQKAIKILNKNQ